MKLQLIKNTFITLWLFMGLGSSLVLAQSQGVKPQDLQRLAQQVLAQTPEFTALQNRVGSEIFVENRTSVELLTYVQRQVEKKGLDKYKAELNSKKPIPLSTWHSVNAPLDISASPQASLRLKSLPSTTAYAGIEVNRFSPIKNPLFEVRVGATSSLFTENLNQLVGKKVNIQIPESILSAKNPEASLRAGAELIEFMADNPDLQFTDSAQQQAETLFRKFKESPKTFAPVLEKGNTLAKVPRTEAEKIVSIFERAQLGARADIPESTGMRSLFESAGGLVKSYRQQNTIKIVNQEPATAMRVLHVTSEAGAQGFERGRVARSTGLNQIAGNSSGVAFGDGLYTVPDGDIPPYPGRLVEIDLDPNCLQKRTCELVDGDRIVRVISNQAILKTRVVPKEEYFERLVKQLKNAPAYTRSQLMRSALSLVNPEINPDDQGKWSQLKAIAEKAGASDELLKAYYSQPGRIDTILAQPDSAPTKSELLKYLKSYKPGSGDVIISELIKADPALVEQNAELKSRVDNYLQEAVQGRVNLELNDVELNRALDRYDKATREKLIFKNIRGYSFNFDSSLDRELLEKLKKLPDNELADFFTNLRAVETRADVTPNDIDYFKFQLNRNEIAFRNFAKANPEAAAELLARGLELPERQRPDVDLANSIDLDNVSASVKQRLSDNVSKVKSIVAQVNPSVVSTPREDLSELSVAALKEKLAAASSDFQKLQLLDLLKDQVSDLEFSQLIKNQLSLKSNTFETKGKLLELLQDKTSKADFKALAQLALENSEVDNFAVNFIKKNGLENDKELLATLEASLKKNRLANGKALALLENSPELNEIAKAALRKGGLVDEDLVSFLARDTKHGGIKFIKELAQQPGQSAYNQLILSNSLKDAAKMNPPASRPTASGQATSKINTDGLIKGLLSCFRRR